MLRSAALAAFAVGAGLVRRIVCVDVTVVLTGLCLSIWWLCDLGADIQSCCLCSLSLVTAYPCGYKPRRRM